MSAGDAGNQRDASAMQFADSAAASIQLSRAERKAFRRQTAKHESSWIAASVAAISFILAIANSFIGPNAALKDNVPIFLASLLLAVSAPFLGQRWMPATAVPWISAGLAVVVVGSLQVQEYTNWSATGLVYSLFAIAAYGPIALDFIAAGVAAIPMAIGCVVVSISLHSDATTDWIVASAAAFLISGVLLAVRLRGVDALARSLASHAALATEDPLTGMLNRRGMETRIPQAFGLATRGAVLASAMFVDIDGLKQVNDRFGHNMGDQVIKATAEAIQRSVRAGDFTCRWGGDEFLILALGRTWDAEVLSERIREHLAESRLPEHIWPGTVTFGAAEVDPAVENFDELVRQADAAMYARRASRKF